MCVLTLPSIFNYSSRKPDRSWVCCESSIWKLENPILQLKIWLCIVIVLQLLLFDGTSSLSNANFPQVRILYHKHTPFYKVTSLVKILFLGLLNDRFAIANMSDYLLQIFWIVKFYISSSKLCWRVCGLTRESRQHSRGLQSFSLHHFILFFSLHVFNLHSK